MIALRKKAETTSDITLEWDAITGVAGYRFQSSKSAPKWSHTFDPSRTTIKFAKSDWYKVEALGILDAGQYPPPPAVQGLPLGAWRIATSSVDSVGNASRWRFLMTNPSEYQRIPGWKAQNPNVEALAYKCMGSTRSYTSQPFSPAGMDYAWANANHPDWFLLKGGSRIEWGGYGGHWQMDIGNVAYQNQWASNVIAELRANGWDGIMVDNVQMEPSGIYYSGRPDKYPTQASYQAATRSFLANACAKVLAAGFSVYLNIQAHGQISLSGPALWSDWCQFSSGAVREFWVKWGFGTDMQHGGSTWQNQQDIMASLQADGKGLHALTYCPKSDTRSIRYAWASFLLGWNSFSSSAFFFEPMPEAQEPGSPEIRDIGIPTAQAVQVGGGWKRTYSGGTVYVNPSSASVTIDGRLLASMTGLVT